MLFRSAPIHPDLISHLSSSPAKLGSQPGLWSSGVPSLLLLRPLHPLFLLPRVLALHPGSFQACGFISPQPSPSCPHSPVSLYWNIFSWYILLAALTSFRKPFFKKLVSLCYLHPPLGRGSCSSCFAVSLMPKSAGFTGSTLLLMSE